MNLLGCFEPCWSALDQGFEPFDEEPRKSSEHFFSWFRFKGEQLSLVSIRTPGSAAAEPVAQGGP